MHELLFVCTKTSLGRVLVLTKKSLLYSCRILLLCLCAAAFPFLTSFARAQGVPLQNPYQMNFTQESELIDGAPALASIHSNLYIAFRAQNGVKHPFYRFVR